MLTAIRHLRQGHGRQNDMDYDAASQTPTDTYGITRVWSRVLTGPLLAFTLRSVSTQVKRVPATDRSHQPISRTTHYGSQDRDRSESRSPQ